MAESDEPLNRAARREEHLLSGSGGRSKWSWFHRSRQRALHLHAKGVQALQSSGVQFLSCHTATEEQARIFVCRNKLSQSSEEVVEDMLAHTVPGVLVLASMVAAIALLQAEGHYTYITV
jgi:hypothetical protein